MPWSNATRESRCSPALVNARAKATRCCSICAAQAFSEVSGVLGRLPSRVGYQPTLASEVSALQERIVSVGDVSVTAIEAVYVPADDFTDPAVTTIAAHIDSMVVLSRQMAA